jgi:hypothetical protein
MSADVTFAGEIIVASRIVDYLSSGLYESPASCLKELINNSYDADATQVNVYVKPDADRIIIEDNGIGMSKEDFLKHFTKISESHKRDDSSFTELQRPKIGKIGIGFIAANEICDVMELYSTCAGSRELLHVNINFDVMRADTEARRRDGDDFAKADYEGKVLETELENHYTVLFLKKVRGEARSILAGVAAAHRSAGELSLYGLHAASIKKILQPPALRSWSELDSYSQNMLQIALNVPVRYYDGWIPEQLKDTVTSFAKATTELSFNVSMDGTELFKPIVFNPDRGAFVDAFHFEGLHVAASGYFYVQHGAIRPQDLQGLLIRIRNAAIGGYDPTFLGFSSSEGPLLQSWVSTEIWADDRLEDAMNIDRRTLRVAHPAYVELQVAVHEHLSGLLKRARAELYGEGSRARRHERAARLVSSIAMIADSSVSMIGETAATEIKHSWAAAAESQETERRILKKIDVAQLYRLVIEVATEVLTPEQAKLFLKRLTRRLTR